MGGFSLDGWVRDWMVGSGLEWVVRDGMLGFGLGPKKIANCQNKNYNSSFLFD